MSKSGLAFEKRVRDLAYEAFSAIAHDLGAVDPSDALEPTVYAMQDRLRKSDALIPLLASFDNEVCGIIRNEISSITGRK